MSRASIWITPLLLIALLGCEPQGAAPEVEKVVEVETEPAGTVMEINGALVAFPPARMKMQTDEQQVVAMLYSDDPPQALRDDYDGNSFYLRMALDVDDPADLSSAVWMYKSPSAERRDSPFGIFLGGRKIALEPYDVRATFHVGETLLIRISGQFLLYQAGESSLGQTTLVNAEFPVQLDPPRRR